MRVVGLHIETIKIIKKKSYKIINLIIKIKLIWKNNNNNNNNIKTKA